MISFKKEISQNCAKFCEILQISLPENTLIFAKFCEILQISLQENSQIFANFFEIFAKLRNKNFAKFGLANFRAHPNL